MTSDADGCSARKTELGVGQTKLERSSVRGGLKSTWSNNDKLDQRVA